MTYRNVGTQPIQLPDGTVLAPGDDYTGDVPADVVAWFVSIGAFAPPPDRSVETVSDDEGAPSDEEGA